MSVSCSVVRRVDLEDAREGVTAMVTCQGFVYVTHSVRSSVWAYTAQGELHFQQSLPGLENPYRMTIVTEGDNGPSYMIIVDRNKTLFWLKMLQPGNFIFEMSQILDFQPTAIASFGGCLILGDTNSHTIWMSGQKLTEIKAHCLSVPSDVHIDHIVSCPTTTQQLVMVDTFNKRLTWITSEGDVTNRCSTGNINGLDTPSDVVYVDEDLLVCDATNNSVHVIDKDLNNSDILLKGPLEIWNPHRLAYCNINKQLYVATWDKYGEQPQLLTLTYICKALK